MVYVNSYTKRLEAPSEPEALPEGEE